ncbi:hypothetical protein [Microbacterium pumilum]|uniref:Chaplin domain-containing protein n=1 Tax=Microbacterium pumilum TaxID=344165 RepID=A0ABP5DDD3_9MICO
MHTFITRALLGTLLAGGITLLGATVANAAETTVDDGLVSGTQALIDIQAPVTIAGNAISVIGDSSSTAPAPAPAPAPASAPAATTSGNHGIGSGTQAIVTVAVPITVSDNAISVIGDSSSTAPAPAPAPVAAAAPSASTEGDDSILGGTQVIAPVAVPVTVSGNAISVIGDSSAASATEGAPAPGTTPPPVGGATSGDDSILGGTQVIAPITAPSTVTGNAIAIIGESITETVVVPAVSTEPTEPTVPANPTDPTEPTVRDSTTDSVTAVGTDGTIVGAKASTTATQLAATGGPNALVALLMSVGLIAAGLTARVLRRRSA